MAFSLLRKPVEILAAASLCLTLLLTAAVCGGGTTVLGAKLDVQRRLATSSISTGNLSVFIFQTSISILVPCTTPLIRPPRFHEPPVRSIIAIPMENGTYPVILFKHGFNLANCFYTQLFEYLASSGYIVVAPQAVTLSSDCTEEIDETAKVANWIPNSLAVVLNAAVPNVGVAPNVWKLIMAGHSRGGKIAFAMALGKATRDVPSFAALVTLDPVDGTGPDSEMIPQMVKAGCKHTDNALSIPILILGTGYGSERAGLGVLPPCAPSCCSHEGYFNCSSSPLMYHLSALEYGHLDFLDDSQFWTPTMCVSGSSKAPFRNFSGRLVVAFLQATLEGNEEDMDYLLENWEEIDSVKLDEPQIYVAEEDARLDGEGFLLSSFFFGERVRLGFFSSIVKSSLQDEDC